TIIAELTRITSHQLWFGSLGLDLGAVSPFFWAFREREIIFEILEETCGTRLTMNYIVPGGVMKDLYPTFVKRVKEVLNQLKDTMHEYDKLLTGNVILQSRLKGVGHISAEDAISYGCSGPIARASGVVCDIRKRHPYEAYDKVEFKEIIRTGGDCFDRYLLRLDEMRESIHIIEQLIDNIPEGSYRENLKGVVKLPAGEYYQRVETARGELGVYITSDGGSKPYRLKYRTPCFSNLGILPPMLKGTKIADMVAIMATLDLIIPDIDR
ncbi:MAG: NADH-quinone oxidoreductase subunit D, partial [Bacteroidota bacterium]|nr:NADH-quinone oxidoreductase subunit D [Bacteroidota bacterium]